MTSFAHVFPDAVIAALAEFRSVGRDFFLDKYGFGRSRDYFLVDDGLLVDTKPLLAAAYAISHPDRAPLEPTDFSGGAASTVAVLRRLGFRVGTRAELFPPQLGTEFAGRADLHEAYGGDKDSEIFRFPWEEIVNVFLDADNPYADDLRTLTAPFGYRGEGLKGAQNVYEGGNLLLEGARTREEAVRFWYRPRGGRVTFLSWAVVIGRSWNAGFGSDGLSRPEVNWMIEPVPGVVREQWPAEVVMSLQDDAKNSDDGANVPEAAPAPTYGQLIDRVEMRGQPRRPTGVVRTDYGRSAAARRAVLIRSGGCCEGPRCTGMPSEPNRRGEPILDVDHVQDLAKGGEDHPRNMVALCPNCHAVKTRGANEARWRNELGRRARAAHAAMRGSE